jgi:hypothetical protein
VRVEAARRSGGTVSVEHFRVVSYVRMAVPDVGAGMRLTRLDVDPVHVDAAVAA